MKRYIFAILACILAFSPLSAAHAETVLRVGNGVSVDEDQVVDGNYYVSAGFGNTTMSGTVKEDMYALGGTVTVNGTVDNDLSIVSGTAQVHAPITGDARIVSGETTIAGHVGGDLFVIGGTLQVLSTAVIDGNIFFFGGDAVIDGAVHGSIFGSANSMRVNATVDKNVEVKTGSLILGERANIAGSLSYSSAQDLVRAQNATVAGPITHNQLPEEETPSLRTHIRQAALPFFAIVFAALSLFLLFRKELLKLMADIEHATFRSSLVGVCVLVLGPIAAIILMITLIGALIGVALLTLLLCIYIISFATSAIMLGALLSRLITKQMKISFVWVLCGCVLLQLVLYIPFLGPLFILAVMCAVVGSVSRIVYRHLE